jgi:peptide deformylase
VRPIRLIGDPVLLTPADPVVDFDKELRTLVHDLTDTMVDAPGVGLAAPQIGVGLRVFTWLVDGEVGHLVNPDLALSEETQDGPEGCLSIPDLTFDCVRAMRVVAKGMNMYGDPVTIEGSDLLAVASSTRPTTSTACCSSTGSTGRRAKPRCGPFVRRTGTAKPTRR